MKRSISTTFYHAPGVDGPPPPPGATIDKLTGHINTEWPDTGASCRFAWIGSTPATGQRRVPHE